MRNGIDRRWLGSHGGLRVSDQCPKCDALLGNPKMVLMLQGEEGVEPKWLNFRECSFCNHRVEVDA